MAFDKSPAVWIGTSWSEDGTNVTFPISHFPQLTADEADAATGDIRKIVFAVLHKLHAEWVAKGPENQPSKMNVAKGVSENTSTGVQTATFFVSFDTNITGIEVADE